MRLVWLLVLSVLVGPSALAQSGVSGQGDASFTFKGTYLSRYLFRGHTFQTDSTYQGEVGLGIASWSYNLVYSDAVNTPFAFDQEYHHSVSFTTVTPRSVTTMGYNFFDYDGDQPDTQEFYIRHTWPSRWNPTYGVAYDIDTYKGFYIDFGFSRSIPLTIKSGLLFSLKGGMAYDLKEKKERTGTILEPGFFGKDGYTHTTASVDYQWQPSRWLTFKTGATYYRAADRFLYEPLGLDRDETFWQGSLTVALP